MRAREAEKWVGQQGPGRVQGTALHSQKMTQKWASPYMMSRCHDHLPDGSGSDLRDRDITFLKCHDVTISQNLLPQIATCTIYIIYYRIFIKRLYCFSYFKYILLTLIREYVQE